MWPGTVRAHTPALTEDAYSSMQTSTDAGAGKGSDKKVYDHAELPLWTTGATVRQPVRPGQSPPAGYLRLGSWSGYREA